MGTYTIIEKKKNHKVIVVIAMAMSSAFIGVDLQDRKEDAIRFIREFDISYPNAPDPTGEVSISYGVSGLPVTFFVSREGHVLRRWVGALERKVLVSFIKEIMQ